MIRWLLARLRRRGPDPAPRASPLLAYDRLIEALEHRTAQLRRSAASLLSVQRGLERAGASQAVARSELAGRLRDARAAGDAKLSVHLERDLADVERELGLRESQASRLRGDAELLLSQLSSLQQELEGLQRERAEAALLLETGRALVDAQQSASLGRVEHLLALDAARDELARAEALVAIHREDAKG